MQRYVYAMGVHVYSYAVAEIWRENNKYRILLFLMWVSTKFPEQTLDASVYIHKKFQLSDPEVFLWDRH